jgi:hypothetical protein
MMRAWVARVEVWAPLLTAALFMGLSLAGGAVYRAPFDDEVFTLNVIVAQKSLMGVFWFFSGGGDVHPPLPTMLHWLLWHGLGLREVGLRWVSLGVSAFALVLAHRLVLKLGPQKLVVPVWVQVLVSVLLGTTPLFLGQGDAIRWYPLFGLVFMLALRAMVRGRRLELTPLAGWWLGVLFSVNFLGAVVGVALVGMVAMREELRPTLRMLPWFVVLGAVGAASGVLALWANLMMAHHVDTQFKAVGGLLSHLQPVLEIGLGILGGYRVGIGFSWVLVPGVVASGWAVWRLRQHALVWVLVANVLVLLPIVVLGFNKPRALMDIALLLAMVNGLAVLSLVGRERLLVVAALLVSQGGVVSVLHPAGEGLKRNLAIPYDDLVAEVRGVWADGVPTAVWTTDYVLVWELTKPGAVVPAGSCVSFYRENMECVTKSAKVRLVTVVGQGGPEVERQAIMAATAGRERLKAAVFGYDREAGLKTRLTGVALTPWILEMGVWKVRK